MTFPVDRWPELSALLDEALALTPSDRIAWLAARERDRPDLATPLRRLLEAHARPEGIDPLHARPTELMAQALAQRRPDTSIAAGDLLGPYRLLAPLGEGGMASVWLAEQTLSVLRRVALKVPHPGLEDPIATAARFARERDFLAGLEHPHIARLYDAGVSEAGVPYLAMEWIDGVPITRYADDHRLTVAARIGLFQKVLEAVRFAHARLVIHRDIKPSNILVTAAGEVKLLDFGIARLLGDSIAHDPLGGAARIAGSTRRALTPEAASPEQLAGQTLATPSDVYSLGVVLYELLCGVRPYRLDGSVTSGEPADMLAAVLAVRIAAPSTRAIDAATAEQRRLTPRRLRRELAGDLDAIVAKSLMKDPEQRYDGAQTLAADLERWSTGRPVEARRAGPVYRAIRFVARHRVSIAAASAVTFALAAGLGVSLWQAEHARREARAARAVQEFLVSLFDASDPQEAQGRDVSAKDLLDRGSTRLDSELQDQPAILARLHHAVGGIYIQLGNNLLARPHIEKSLALYRTLGLEGSEDAIEAQYNLSELLTEELQYDASRQAALRCLALADRYFGHDNRWRVPVQARLAQADMEQGHAQAGADRLSVAIAESERAGIGPDVRVIKARADLANAYMTLGRLAQARDEFTRVIQDSRSIPRYEITDGFVDRHNLARARFNLREFEAAERELETLVPAMEQHIGAQHDRTIKTRSLWAQALSEVGKYQQAIAVQEVNLAHARARPATDDDIVSLQELTLAKILRTAVRPHEGLPLARKGLNFMDSKYAEPTWYTEVGRRLLAELLLEDGQVDEAMHVLVQAEERSQRIDNYANSTNFADLMQAKASTLRVRGQPGDANTALDLIQRAKAIYDDVLGAGNTASLRCDVQIAWLRARRPDSDAAAEQQFLAAADTYDHTLPPGHLGRAETDFMRADLGGRAGASDLLRSQAQEHRKQAREAWIAAVGRELNFVLTVLH